MNILNVNIDGTVGLKASITFGALNIGNFSFGMPNLGIDLNPINWFLNFGLGGGGGSEG